jgi:TPR repeat protein
MKNRFFRLLGSLIILGLLIACAQHQIPKNEVLDDFKNLIKLAEKGNIDAQFNLASMYDSGDGVPQDRRQAAYWYSKAAEQGHVGAEAILAAEQGNADDQFSLGWMYYIGEVVPQDYQQAVYWYTKAAEQGHMDAQSHLALMYDSGEGVLQDHRQAAYWYSKAAEQGSAGAQYNLGLMYYIGEVVPKNYQQAVYWYTKAAEQGHMDAQFNLASMYGSGEGVPQDHRQAAYWYSKAAEQGSADDQYNLGVMYAHGIGVPQDYQQAFYWFTKAAEQGHVGAETILAAEQGNAEAQYNLGWKYYYGEGVPQDYKQAFYWFTKAAEQGYASAQHSLGVMYNKGKGEPQDYEQAVYWYTKAAEQGHAVAQQNLGVMYGTGQGVPQNNRLAYVWSSLAAAAGREGARHNRDLYARSLTPQVLAEAQELAATIQYEINHPTDSSKSYHATPETSAVYEQEVNGFGTGFIISKEGHVLTCYHVVQNAGTIKVKVGRNLHSAALIRKDSINDLALLKLKGSFPALALSSKRIAKMGQEVFTVGYPNPILQGVNAKLTKGSINSLTGIQDDLRLYQISVPVQPGNSGGPLLDMNGNVIGIIVAMLDAKTVFEILGSLPQNVNYAVKSTYAQALLDTLPEISGNLISAYPKKPFTDVVNRVKKSIVMVVAYE